MPTPIPVPPHEITKLDPLSEVLFKGWATANGITDVDEPDSHYDYRGFYQNTGGRVHPPGSVEHFPDTFKQHGHPTFSQESKYSTGPSDGGMWIGENKDHFLEQPPLGVSHDPSVPQLSAQHKLLMHTLLARDPSAPQIMPSPSTNPPTPKEKP